MNILLKPTKEFLKEYPEYKGKKFVFKGESGKEKEKWGHFLIDVKIGKNKTDSFDTEWFKDLNIK